MEVQRMTLSTLKTMNVSMGELREAMTLKMPDQPEAAAAAPAPAPAVPQPAARKSARQAAAAPAPGVVDPMQWWGALTKQFTELAANAMKDSATDAAKNLAGAMVKQSFDAAGETLKKAVAMPASVAQKAASAAGAVTAAAVGAASRPAAKPAPAKRAPAKTAARRPAARKKT